LFKYVNIVTKIILYYFMEVFQVKKVIAILVWVAMLSVMMSIAVFAEVAGDRARNQVTFAKGTAVIDGVKDDCYQAAGTIIADLPNAGVAGTDFAKFTGYAVYDADALYVFGHVADPSLSPDNADWNGDSVELFFNYELAAGVGTTDETEVYGTIGCMQFRACPIPVVGDDGTEHVTYTYSTGHGFDDEIAADLAANPKNYLTAVDADKKGYTIEMRFPFPSAMKAAVKADYKIGFSVQVNDAQGGDFTTPTLRTGTIHSVDGDQMEQNWQYIGSLGRGIFTANEYVAPAAPADASAPADTATPAATDNPSTADITVIMSLLAVVSAFGGAVAFKKSK
jgi:hypothetical protein